MAFTDPLVPPLDSEPSSCQHSAVTWKGHVAGIRRKVLMALRLTTIKIEAQHANTETPNPVVMLDYSYSSHHYRKVGTDVLKEVRQTLLNCN